MLSSSWKSVLLKCIPHNCDAIFEGSHFLVDRKYLGFEQAMVWINHDRSNHCFINLLYVFFPIFASALKSNIYFKFILFCYLEGLSFRELVWINIVLELHINLLETVRDLSLRKDPRAVTRNFERWETLELHTFKFGNELHIEHWTIGYGSISITKKRPESSDS